MGYVKMNCPSCGANLEHDGDKDFFFCEYCGTKLIKSTSFYNPMSFIDGMEGHKFEYFCANLLRKVGFSDVRVTPGSGDQGVDILAIKDSIKYAIQCKNYASVLGNTPVQEVSAGKQFYGCHVGVVMTNSTFSSGAVQLAATNNVLLWDRTKMEELISVAGGLQNLGVQQNYTVFNNSNLDDNLDNDSEDDFDEKTFSSNIKTTPPKKGISNIPKRKGLQTWSKICFGWTIICFVLCLLGVLTYEDSIIFVCLGEGLFSFVIGFMLKILSTSEKCDPYVMFLKIKIKKTYFVFACLVVSFFLFMLVMES